MDGSERLDALSRFPFPASPTLIRDHCRNFKLSCIGSGADDKIRHESPEPPMPMSKAEADLARANADVRRLEAQLEEARERAVKIAHYIEMARVYEAGESPIPQSKRGSGGRAAAAAQMAVEILREKKRPLHTRDLLDEMNQRGLVFDSLNPVTNLSSALSRSGELIADRSTGWRLVEWKTLDLDDELNRLPGNVSSETTDDPQSDDDLDDIL